jgi:hypothetical protein
VKVVETSERIFEPKPANNSFPTTAKRKIEIGVMMNAIKEEIRYETKGCELTNEDNKVINIRNENKTYIEPQKTFLKESALT